MGQLGHMLEDMMGHYEASLDFFVADHKENNLVKLTDNRYYKEVSVMIRAMNVVRKAIGEQPLKLSDELEYRL